MSVINPLAAIIPVAPATVWHPPREGREHDLRLHQIVRASVAEGGQERVMLELGQRRFWADTKLPLKTGQMLNLQVLATSPRLELTPVEDPLAERLAHLLHLIGEKWQLAAVLRDLVGTGGAPQAPDSGLRTVLGQLLQMLETAPAALTGVSLRELLDKLAPRARGQDPGGFRELLLEAYRQLTAGEDNRAQEVARLLQQFELSLLCQARLAQSGLTLLPLPLPFVETGFLIAEQGHENRDEQPQALLSLHLCLTGLGNLRIDFLHETAGLFLRFHCSSPETMVFLSSCHEELKTAVAALPLRGASFVGNAEDPVQALLQRLLPSGEGVLNTRV